jgi:uncharacterized membrane protein YsdA (DUF1294 family)
MAFPLPTLPVIIYISLNVLVFALFAIDKLIAKVHAWRIPEIFLLFFAGIGPFGALAAMMGFRHKNRQVKFYLVPFFAILHGVLILWLLPGIS